MMRWFGIFLGFWLGAGAMLSQSPNDVLVQAEGWRIERRELDAIFNRIKTELLATGRLLPDEDQATAKRRLLERLVMARLCLKEANEEDLRKGEEEAQAFANDLRRNYGEDGYRRILNRAGYTEESFIEEKRSEAIVTLFLHRKIRPEIKIPGSDIRQFYESFPQRFQDPEVVHAQILFLDILDPADGEPLTGDALQEKERLGRRIIDRVKAGDEFKPLVQRYSDSLRTRENGGEIKFMRGEMPPEIEGAAFSMKPGQTSDLIRTDIGLHVIHLLDRTSTSTRPLETVEQDIRELLTQREFELRIPSFIQQLRKDQKVEFTEEGNTVR